MKQLLILLSICLLLVSLSIEEAILPESSSAAIAIDINRYYSPRFGAPTVIVLSDEEIQVDNSASRAIKSAVKITNDIIYYEDRETYPRGNPYGEGTPEERHSAEEAAAHTVVNIKLPGAYLITGKLSAGQIRVDLGEAALEDPDAVVELILSNADITCTVAPAILFRNVYECGGNRITDDMTMVNTSAAGANLILEDNNKVSGSHVAKIYKDKATIKKLWKQDGAINSYVSMNISGSGSLELTADKEGISTQKHLTMNGGNLSIFAGDDGMNASQDGNSVITINNGNLNIFSGLTGEGDSLDSNGYLVIHGGTVFCSSDLAATGLDSEETYIDGGTIVSMGAARDWPGSHSERGILNLSFVRQLTSDMDILVTEEDGTELLSFAPNNTYVRPCEGLVLSHSAFTQGKTYHVYLNGQQMCYAAIGEESDSEAQPANPESIVEQNEDAKTSFYLMDSSTVFSGVAFSTE